MPLTHEQHVQILEIFDEELDKVLVGVYEKFMAKVSQELGDLPAGTVIVGSSLGSSRIVRSGGKPIEPGRVDPLLIEQRVDRQMFRIEEAVGPITA